MPALETLANPTSACPRRDACRRKVVRYPAVGAPPASQRAARSVAPAEVIACTQFPDSGPELDPVVCSISVTKVWLRLPLDDVLELSVGEVSYLAVTRYDE